MAVAKKIPKPVNAFFRLFALGAGWLIAFPVFAQRQTSDLLTDWKFLRQDAAVTAPTDSWEKISLPHTWNNLDPQGGLAAHPQYPYGYYRGPGWYEHSLDISPAWKNKRVFIRFEAASTVAQVYLNGKLLGEHRGGFTAFCFELTPGLRFDGPNELRVRVDNTERDDVSPLTGDFNIDGGIYRPVQLIVTDPVCISPLDNASSGVYLTAGAPAQPDASVEVKAVISNGSRDAIHGLARIIISDSTGAVACVSTFSPAWELLRPGQTNTLPFMVKIQNAHLWNGRKDPYLYTVTVEISGDTFHDEVTQPLGLRTVAITNEQGFLLNGQPYSIHGVNVHQDLRGKGWAMSNADHDRDMQMMFDMGVTAIRLAHYPQSEYVHDLADRKGILLWDEIPLVNALRDTPGFTSNASQQLREMILQLYNHPSAAFWGMYNEIDIRDDHFSDKVLGELKREQKELDPSRLNVAASYNFNSVFDTIPDWICYNAYSGWYTKSPGDLAAFIDDGYRTNGNKRIGLSEYGAGANVSQHQEAPVSRPKPDSQVHPEEWQTYVHERDWAQIRDNPKLWGSFLWCMFDFDSAHRNEGGNPGVNDKGLVTADRETKKDAYFFYQANWTDKPMVHIVDSRLVDRKKALTDIEVYSNCSRVELTLNGKSLGAATPDNLHICRWIGVHLQPGANKVEATAPGTTSTDSCNWTYTPTPFWHFFQ